LARWTRENGGDPLEFGGPVNSPVNSPVNASGKTAKRNTIRVDAPHQSPQPTAPTVGRAVAESARSAARGASSNREPGSHEFVIHPGHSMAPPHFLPDPAPRARPERSSRWVALAGQIFAYLGVGGLTVGTVLVLVGYFGGPASYATTGWLVTTAGQMMLFLGVITLISGGMEQTTQEVARRIDTLGERLVRIEQATVSTHAATPTGEANDESADG
jgi:hypothetical protein